MSEMLHALSLSASILALLASVMIATTLLHYMDRQGGPSKQRRILYNGIAFVSLAASILSNHTLEGEAQAVAATNLFLTLILTGGITGLNLRHWINEVIKRKRSS